MGCFAKTSSLGGDGGSVEPGKEEAEKGQECFAARPWGTQEDANTDKGGGRRYINGEAAMRYVWLMGVVFVYM